MSMVRAAMVRAMENTTTALVQAMAVRTTRRHMGAVFGFCDIMLMVGPLARASMA